MQVPVLVNICPVSLKKVLTYIRSVTNRSSYKETYKNRVNSSFMTNLQDQDVASTYKCDNSPGKSIPETRWSTCFYSNVMAMNSPAAYHIYFIIPDFFSELLEQHRLRKATGSGGLQVPLAGN